MREYPKSLFEDKAIFVVESTTGAEIEPMPIDSLEELDASTERMLEDVRKLLGGRACLVAELRPDTD